MRFIVDTNAGKLAKWLRMLGYDAVFFNGTDDAEVISQAFKENRVLLTRDTHIMEWSVIRSGRVRTVLIRSDDPDIQVSQVIGELGITEFPEPFSICLVCNNPLMKISKIEIADNIPTYVWRTQEEFKLCPVCRRIYWRGTHWAIMKQRIEELRGGSTNGLP